MDPSLIAWVVETEKVFPFLCKVGYNIAIAISFTKYLLVINKE